MIPARESIHNEDREKGAESGEQNRELEHDREKGRHGAPVDGLSVNDERIDEPRWTELERDRRQQSRDAANENECAQP